MIFRTLLEFDQTKVKYVVLFWKNIDPKMFSEKIKSQWTNQNKAQKNQADTPIAFLLSVSIEVGLFQNFCSRRWRKQCYFQWRQVVASFVLKKQTQSSDLCEEMFTNVLPNKSLTVNSLTEDDANAIRSKVFVDKRVDMSHFTA